MTAERPGLPCSAPALSCSRGRSCGCERLAVSCAPGELGRGLAAPGPRDGWEPGWVRGRGVSTPYASHLMSECASAGQPHPRECCQLALPCLGVGVGGLVGRLPGHTWVLQALCVPQAPGVILQEGCPCPASVLGPALPSGAGAGCQPRLALGALYYPLPSLQHRKSCAHSQSPSLCSVDSRGSGS